MSIPAFQSLPFNTRQLAEQVPAWLTAASVAQRAHYRERLLAHLRSAARGASIHRRLLTPAQFCEPLLVQALVRRFNLEVDVYATEWVRVDYHYAGGAAASAASANVAGGGHGQFRGPGRLCPPDLDSSGG